MPIRLSPTSGAGRLPLVLVFTLALAASGCAMFGEGITIELDRDQLQRIVGSVFPLDNADDASAVSIVLSQPRVTLEDGADRVGFGLDIAAVVELEPGEGPLAARGEERRATSEAAPQGRGAQARTKVREKARDAAGEAVQERTADREPTTLTGTVAVSSGIRYDNDAGQVFLDGVNIDRLAIDQMPDRFRDPVLRLTSAAIRRALQQTPLYTVDEATTIGNIADTLLRDIAVSDGVLRITIGVG